MYQRAREVGEETDLVSAVSIALIVIQSDGHTGPAQDRPRYPLLEFRIDCIVFRYAMDYLLSTPPPGDASPRKSGCWGKSAELSR